MFQKIISSIILIVLSISITFSQGNPSGGTPQTNSNGQGSVNSNQNLFKGQNQISLPLHSINEDGLDLSVSLNYNNSGIKVNEESSVIGLGFQLNAGGVVTREIYGLPDDILFDNSDDDKDRTGILRNNLGPSIESVVSDMANTPLDQISLTSKNIINKIARGIYDGMSDEFTIQGPFGSIRFYIDYNTGEIQLMSKSSYKVTYEMGSDGINLFQVIAPDGNIYIFQEKEYAEIYSDSDAANICDLNPQSDEFEFRYINQWYLSTIETINSKVVTFNYSQDHIYKNKYTDYRSFIHFNPFWASVLLSHCSSPSECDLEGQQCWEITGAGDPSANGGALCADCLCDCISPVLSCDFEGGISESSLLNPNLAGFLTPGGPTGLYNDFYFDSDGISFDEKINVLRLDEISWTYGSLIFGYTHERSDLFYTCGTDIPNALTDIDYQLNNGSFKKGFRFNYSYFKSPYSNTARLKLESFSKKRSSNNEASETAYYFEYNEGIESKEGEKYLPAKGSNRKDYWGYINATNYTNNDDGNGSSNYNDELSILQYNSDGTYNIIPYTVSPGDPSGDLYFENIGANTPRQFLYNDEVRLFPPDLVEVAGIEDLLNAINSYIWVNGTAQLPYDPFMDEVIGNIPLLINYLETLNPSPEINGLISLLNNLQSVDYSELNDVNYYVDEIQGLYPIETANDIYALDDPISGFPGGNATQSVKDLLAITVINLLNDIDNQALALLGTLPTWFLDYLEDFRTHSENLEAQLDDIIMPIQEFNQALAAIQNINLNDNPIYALPSSFDGLPNDYVTSGLLTRVYFPTGGYSEFVYEPNEFFLEGRTRRGAGVRIKTVNYSTGENGNGTSLNYEYETGALLFTPRFSKVKARSEESLNVFEGIYGEVSEIINKLFKLEFFNNSVKPAPSGGASYVVYKNVTEIPSGKGKTEYEFRCPPFNDNPLTERLLKLEYDVEDDTYQGALELLEFPLVKQPNYSWNMGQLVSKKIYEGNALLYSLENNYLLDSEVLLISGVSASTMYDFDISYENYIASVYEPYHRIGRVYLDNSTQYEQGGVSSNIQYHYNGTSHFFVTKISTTTSNTPTHEVILLYPEDHVGGISDILIDRNYVQSPLESRQELNGVLIGGSKLDYTINQDKIVPQNFYEVRQGVFVLSGKATDWDGDGNITQYHEAKAGADISDPVSNTSKFFSVSDISWSENLLKSYSYLGYKETYNYSNRLVTSYTDINGVKSTYKYDELERLYETTSKNGRATAKFDYSYQPNKITRTIIYSDNSPIQIFTEELDGLGRYIKTERKDNKVIHQIGYDGAGRKTTEYSIGGSSRSTQFDGLDRIRLISDGAGNTTRYDYISGGSLGANSIRNIKIEDANGHLSFNYFDFLGNTTAIKNALNEVTTYSYDEYNRVSTIAPPVGSAYSFGYTSRDLLKTQIIPEGGTSTSVYDNRDRLVLSIDEEGNKIATTYDDLDRVSTSGEYSGGIPSGDYVMENSISVTTPLTMINYVPNKTWLQSMSTRVLEPNGYSNFHTVSNGDIDDIGRAWSFSAENLVGTESTFLTYNDANQITNATIKHNGLEEIGLRYNYIYDNLGRFTESHLTFDNKSVLLNKFGYNSEDFIVSNKLHSEDDGTTFLQSLDYSYDGGGRLTKINDFGTLLREDGCLFDLCDYTITIEGITNPSYTIHQINGSNGAINLPQSQYEITLNSDQNLAADIKEWLDNNGFIAEDVNVSLEHDPELGQYVLYINILLSNHFFESINNHQIHFSQENCCIENGVNNADGNGNDLFALQLTYDKLDIIKTDWQIGCNRQSYDFTNDPLHRIKEGIHTTYIPTYDGTGAIFQETGRYDVTGIEYDPIGNITDLVRNGFVEAVNNNPQFGVIDILHYDYDGNQLDVITDGASGNGQLKGFKPTSSTYTFSDNGNLLNDSGNDNRTISYNIFNLPKEIEEGNGTVKNTYNSLGFLNKREIDNINNTSYDKIYTGNVEYVDNELQSILFSNGRITKNNGNWQYEYFISDHLGNTRVVFSDLDDNNFVDLSEIIQENHYYPFGLELEGEWSGDNQIDWKYNGIEEIEGLDIYQAFYRNYDPSIGKWWQMDPFLKTSESPYAANRNNPILLADPMGDCPDPPCYDQYGRYEYDITAEWENDCPTCAQETMDMVYVYADRIYAETDSREKIHDEGETSWMDEEVGFGESLIPIWGSGKMAIKSYRDGRYIAGTFHTVMAVTDVFAVKSIVTGLGKLGWRGIRAVGRTGRNLLKGNGVKVATNGGGKHVLPMTILREVTENEAKDLSLLITNLQIQTMTTGMEHAVVRLGTNNVFPGMLKAGDRVIVSGGRNGIKFAEDQISLLIGHTHPYATGASKADYKALQQLGQYRQYILDGMTNMPTLIIRQ